MHAVRLLVFISYIVDTDDSSARVAAESLQVKMLEIVVFVKDAATLL